MKTALTSNTPEHISSYFSLYRELLTATHYKRISPLPPPKPNELPPPQQWKLNLEKKVIWSWMIDRFNLFKEKGNPFFDNQEDIAEACGVSESTVKRFISELKEAGYLQINQTRIFGGHKSNSYILLNDLVLVQPNKALKKPVEAFLSEPNAKVAPTPKNASNDFIEGYIDNNNPAGKEWATESIPFDDVPDWIVDSEDDGSIADARDYVEESPIGNVNTPQIHYQPSNKPNDDQRVCKSNQANKRENNGYTLYEIKGVLHTLDNEHLVPASAIDIALFETGLPF